MKKLDENKLANIKGGISGWGVLGIGALVAFLSGLLDGIARPSRCN